MSVRPQEIYLQTQIKTASPGELTLLLYNGLLRFLGQAQDEMQKKNYAAKHTYILRSLDILDELTITLDHKYEISQNLHELYVFMKGQLVEANIKNKPEKLEFCIAFAKEMRDTWAQAIKLAKHEQKHA